jgi:hypothetical protein
MGRVKAWRGGGCTGFVNGRSVGSQALALALSGGSLSLIAGRVLMGRPHLELASLPNPSLTSSDHGSRPRGRPREPREARMTHPPCARGTRLRADRGCPDGDGESHLSAPVRCHSTGRTRTSSTKSHSQTDGPAPSPAERPEIASTAGTEVKRGEERVRADREGGGFGGLSSAEQG